MSVFKRNRKKEIIFTLLQQLAAINCEASLTVIKLFEDHIFPDHKLRLIKSLKKRGNKTLALVCQQISSQFVLPFDPEDILALAQELNNCLGYIDTMAEKSFIYKVYLLKNENLVTLIQLTDNSVREAYQIIVMLENFKVKRRQIRKKCTDISLGKEQSDSRQIVTTGQMLLADNFDARSFLQLKEFYMSAELTVNSCNNLSNIIKEMTIKYV